MNNVPFVLAFMMASIAAVALGLIVQRMIRDAATRHTVLLAALLLPPVLLIAAVAGFELPIASEPATGAIETTIAPATAIASSLDQSIPTLLGLFWLAGAVLALARIAVHASRWRGVAARAEVVSDPAILRRYHSQCLLVRSVEVCEPTVIGILDPIVVLPASYDFEPAELDAVFAHELAHIARGDNLTALAVQIVCAAFWFDPLHHVARRKLVELRERVCDDLVLERGCDPDAYVTALARTCETSFQSPAVACMSRLKLHERMEWIMTHETRRRWPASITRALVTSAVAVLAVVFATFAPAPSLTAGDATAGEYDFYVRAVPHPDSSYTLMVRIDAPEGPFSSVAIVQSAPATRTVSTTDGGKTYQVVVNLAGDGMATGTLNVTAGEIVLATKTRSFEREMVQPAGVPPAPPRPKENVTTPRPIHRVEPLYTDEAKQNLVGGVVIIEASIDEKGNVTDTRIVKGLPAGLDQSAVDAIRQWKFEPGTLDGKPVAAQFNVTINFRPKD